MMITAHIHPDAKKIIKNQKVKEYEKNLIKIGSCDNIKDFWNIFQHMKQPKDLSPGIDYQIFKKDSNSRYSFSTCCWTTSSIN